MKVKFFGVRGSFPVPGNNTVKYGGNTSCVTLTNETKDGKIDRLIVDCGTGAVNLGKEILGNYFQKKEELDIMFLFTHLHPDHTQGFPFFAPNYFKDCNINLYGMKALKKTVGQVLEQSMLPPTFPIEYKDLKSKREHFIVKDESTFLSGLKTMQIEAMQAYAPSHPQQGAIYYKITDLTTGKKIACIWDLESKVGGDKAVVNFIKDCDLMIHDTQYTHEEYYNSNYIVQGFGHSTYDMAMENMQQAGVKKMFTFHYNPAHSDEILDKISQTLPDTVLMAKEGLEVEI